MRSGKYETYRSEAMAMVDQGMSFRSVARYFGVHRAVIERWAGKPETPVNNPIQPWEDSGEVIHMGNLGRVLAEQYGQAWEDDE